MARDRLPVRESLRIQLSRFQYLIPSEVQFGVSEVMEKFHRGVFSDLRISSASSPKEKSRSFDHWL